MRAKVFVTLLVAVMLFSSLCFAADGQIQVKQIMISGNSVIDTETLAKIVAGFEGRSLTLKELQGAAALITEEYHRQGFILAMAYLPEQSITDGVVLISVLEGKVGDVKVQGDHKYYSTEFIKRHFNNLKNSKALDQDSLERALLVLNDYPKLKVSAALQAGQEPGTTDLVVTADNSFPYQFMIDYNNFGSRYVGSHRFGAQFEIGNVLTEGALFSIRVVSGSDPSDVLYGRASYSLPINTLGTRVGVYYQRGSFDVGREFAILNMEGKSEDYGIFINHPFIKKKNRVFAGELGFDVKNSWQGIFSEKTSMDKVRSVRLGVTLEDIDTYGKTSGSLFLTQGLGHSLGAMENDDPASSRPYAKADNNFFRANLDLLRVQKVAEPAYMLLRFSGQLAAQPLVATEQFSIGGADSVRGYPVGEYSGDHGFAATAEMRYSPLQDRKVLQLAAFLDYGGIRNIKPAPGQTKSKELFGGGIGVRLGLPYEIDIRADMGFPISPTSNSEGKSPVFYVQVAKRF